MPAQRPGDRLIENLVSQIMNAQTAKALTELVNSKDFGATLHSTFAKPHAKDILASATQLCNTSVNEPLKLLDRLEHFDKRPESSGAPLAVATHEAVAIAVSLRLATLQPERVDSYTAKLDRKDGQDTLSTPDGKDPNHCIRLEAALRLDKYTTWDTAKKRKDYKFKTGTSSTIKHLHYYANIHRIYQGYGRTNIGGAPKLEPHSPKTEREQVGQWLNQLEQSTPQSQGSFLWKKPTPIAHFIANLRHSLINSDRSKNPEDEFMRAFERFIHSQPSAAQARLQSIKDALPPTRESVANTAEINWRDASARRTTGLQF